MLGIYANMVIIELQGGGVVVQMTAVSAVSSLRKKQLIARAQLAVGCVPWAVDHTCMVAGCFL